MMLNSRINFYANFFNIIKIATNPVYKIREFSHWMLDQSQSYLIQHHENLNTILEKFWGDNHKVKGNAFLQLFKSTSN